MQQHGTLGTMLFRSWGYGSGLTTSVWPIQRRPQTQHKCLVGAGQRGRGFRAWCIPPLVASRFRVKDLSSRP